MSHQTAKHTLTQQTLCSKWRVKSQGSANVPVWANPQPCSSQSPQPLFHHNSCSWCFGELQSATAASSRCFSLWMLHHSLSLSCALHLPSPLHLSLTEYPTQSHLIFPIILPCSPSESIRTCWTVLVLAAEREAQGKWETNPEGFWLGKISVISGDSLEHPRGISSGGCPWGKEGCGQVPGNAGNT